jgi:hypothetical protein
MALLPSCLARKGAAPWPAAAAAACFSPCPAARPGIPPSLFVFRDCLVRELDLGAGAEAQSAKWRKISRPVRSGICGGEGGNRSRRNALIAQRGNNPDLYGGGATEGQQVSRLIKRNSRAASGPPPSPMLQYPSQILVKAELRIVEQAEAYLS